MERYEATGCIEGGRLLIDRDRIAQAIKGMPDGPVRVEVRRERASRSTQQLRYLWGVVYALIAEHTGYTPEEVHDAMKALHMPRAMAFADANGVVVGELVIGASTTKLDTKQMGDYITAVKMFALDKLAVVIPEADAES